MTSLRCPLILSDFDSTITNTKGEITAVVKDAINAYVAAGGIFCIITGRMLSAIMPRVTEIGLKGLVAAYQGSMIADIETGKILRSNSLTMDECMDICRILEDLGQPFNYYVGDKFYTDRHKDDPVLQRYCEIIRTEPCCVEDEKMSSFITRTGLLAQKFCCLVDKDKRDDLLNKLREMRGDVYDVTASASILVELSPKGDNKGSALEYIAAYYGVPMEKTVAVGDNLNDLTMIQKAGVGVAVKNAHPDLVAAADHVTVSCDENAVAKVISDFGFGNA